MEPTTPTGSPTVSSRPSGRRNRNAVPSYERDRSNETASQTMARDIAKRRRAVVQSARTLGGNYRKGVWFDAAGRMIGTGHDEDDPIKFVRPRRLYTKGAS
jgi:hypothetical protein